MAQKLAPAEAPLRTRERLAVVLFFVLLAAFGVLVEMRSVFMTRRMGDFGCYARGAWAVRTGNDLYDVTDDNNWHYNYPPMLAILMAPLADPPRGVDTPGMTPYAVSVAFWYIFSLVCMFLAAHWLARALEERSPDSGMRWQLPGCRRWWALRLWPLLLCAPVIGHTLMRGQVNTLLLALLCGMVAGLLRQAHFRAGLCLAGTICIKVFPAFLLIYPLWHRNWRCLGGCLAGLFIGLVAIPVAAFGPARTVEVYEKYATVLLRPALHQGSDDTRNLELLGVNATWSQAFKVVAHKTLFLDRATRPAQIAPWLDVAHLVVGGGLTLVVLLAGRRSATRTTTVVYSLGGLFLLMILLCPVCHLHYFTFAVPVLMAFLAHRWEGRTTLSVGRGLTVLFSAFLLLNALPQFDELEVLRDLGLAMYSGLLLIGAAIVAVWRTAGPQPGRAAHDVPPLRAAA